MHRILMLLVILIVSVSMKFTLATGTSNQMPNIVTFTTTNSAPNHVLVNEQAEGVAVDALECIMGRMSQAYRIQFLPWKRAQALVESGESDGFFLASQNESRDKFAVLSKSLDKQVWSFYLLKSSLLNNVEEIKVRANTGAKSNTAKQRWLKKNKFKVIIYPSTMTPLIQALIIGRIDAFLEADHRMQEYFQLHPEQINKFKKIKVKKISNGVYLGNKFLDQYPGFMNVFNSHVSTCEM